MLVLPVNINIYNKNYRSVQKQSFGAFFRRKREENKDTFVKTSDNKDFSPARIYEKDVFEAVELSLKNQAKKCLLIFQKMSMMIVFLSEYM